MNPLDKLAEAIFMSMLRICIFVLVVWLQATVLTFCWAWSIEPLFLLPPAGMRECVGFVLMLAIAGYWLRSRCDGD